MVADRHYLAVGTEGLRSVKGTYEYRRDCALIRKNIKQN